ncbi:MAG: glucose 1-dehydrogenase [Acidimicrobiia bacterium]|nr:glucose 1-dehydrogenase [Acidimicrobiia bacterium]
MSILDRFRVDDKVAVVTGAGRGIGAASAIALAEAGADVALTARSADQLEEVATTIRGLGRRAFVYPGDVNDLDMLPAFVEATVAELGRIDIVVNNAGGSPPAAVTDITAKSFEAAFHFNVTTALVLTQACIPQLVANRGNVVNISSMAGRTAARALTQYGVAKAALSHLTRYLATDLNPKVRVNAIAVGSTATSALETVLTMPEIRDAMIAATPLRFIGEPEDIAAGVLYLASPAARYVTGKVFEIDGGTESSTLDIPIPDF